MSCVRIHHSDELPRGAKCSFDISSPINAFQFPFLAVLKTRAYVSPVGPLNAYSISQALLTIREIGLVQGCIVLQYGPRVLARLSSQNIHRAAPNMDCSLQCIQQIGCRRCTAHRVFSRKYTESHYSIRSTVVPANCASTPSSPILAVMARQPLSEGISAQAILLRALSVIPTKFPKEKPQAKDRHSQSQRASWRDS